MHVQVFALDQNLTFEYQGINFLLTVTNLVVTDKMGDQVGAKRAQLVATTGFLFEVAAGSGLKIAGQKSVVAPQLFKHKEFNFEKLGIGGLDNQFEQIFRRAFASRVFPPSVVERLGIHHVKGVLLFGPPGTGGSYSPCIAVLQCAVLCCAVLCCAVLCCAVLCCAVLCCAVLGWAGLRCAVVHCAKLLPGCLFSSLPDKVSSCVMAALYCWQANVAGWHVELGARLTQDTLVPPLQARP